MILINRTKTFRKVYRLALIAMALLVTSAPGCKQQPTPTPEARHAAPAKPWQITVPVTGATGVVDSLTVTRDSGGGLLLFWQTELGDGSRAMMALGRWAPKPELGIPNGPILGQLGIREISVSGGGVRHAGQFTKGGLPHPAGEYYATLTINSGTGNWQQPADTAKLVKAFGKKDNYGGLGIDALARFTLEEPD